MTELTKHQQQVLARAQGDWQTQRQLRTSRGTITTLLALGLLRRQLLPGNHTKRPESGSIYKAAEG